MRKVLLFLGILFSYTLRANEIDLAGSWMIALDSTEHIEDVSFSKQISLPGTTDDAEIGMADTLSVKLEKAQLRHLRRKYSYIGVAWYQRTVDIDASMADKTLSLLFERVMWSSELWIDGKKIDAIQESLVSPHEYLLYEGLKKGKHTITLRIDNRKRYDISYEDMAHAYTNETQIMWNGVLGKMTMKALEKTRMYDLQIYPDVKSQDVRVSLAIENMGKKRNAKLQYIVPNINTVTKDITLQKGTNQIDVTVPVNGIKQWSEFHPNVYSLSVVCDRDTLTSSFGMRDITTEGKHLLVNGNRIFLRGTLECCVFPLTGAPPTTTEGWQKVFVTAKKWGLNHLRFHSWCPPAAAFQVADSMGFYLQVELPQWSLKVNQDRATNKFLYNEYDNIIRNYGNHPSLCLISCGNELQPDFTFLNNMVKYMKSKDRRHLYTTSSFTFEKGHGKHPEPEDEFFVTQYTDSGWVRGQGLFDEYMPSFDEDYDKALQAVNVPIISHEIGQYSVYPNISEIEKYTGILKPLNFMTIKEDLQRKGLLDKASAYTNASGKFAALLYKEEIERAMKTSNFSGIQLLGLTDFPGQGTALVGLLDAFWDSKCLIDADSFRQFCAPVVPLIKYEKAVYTSNEVFNADLIIANYSESSLNNSEIHWSIMSDDGRYSKKGILKDIDVRQGGTQYIGQIQSSLSEITVATKLTVNVAIDGTEWQNNWSIWVYPSKIDVNFKDIFVTRNYNEANKAYQAGRKVLYCPELKDINGLEGKFLPVFWSPVHFPDQAGTMGILCNPSHPALKNFPTDSHSNWQWWNIVKNAKVMVLDHDDYCKPIVECVDNFANNRRLALIVEKSNGKGRMITCSIDLLSEEHDCPEMRQLKYSLLKYLTK